MEVNASRSKNNKRFNRIYLFCGSRTGYKPIFDQAAVELCKHLIVGETHGELRIVADMHERKSEMKSMLMLLLLFLVHIWSNIQTFILAPFIVQMIAWSQFRIHEKPVKIVVRLISANFILSYNFF
ncbi:putative cytokinin riboside 5'-monophosphate phosphoribohydrolase LOGL6 [Bienertia sinuspersici]